MNQRQVEVFLSVMRHGSVTEAAEKLRMSQPSVSKNLALAERQLGFGLFERVRGRLVPTAEASLVFEEAMRIEEEIARFGRFLVNVKQFKIGQLRVAATPALSIALVPMAARLFREQFADYGLVLDMQLNHEIKDAVESHQYDLGLLVLPSDEETDDTQVLKRGAMVCVMPEAHALAARRTVDWQDINARELIYITTDVKIISLMTRLIPHFGGRGGAAIETNRYTVAVNLVRNGLGVTIVDEFTLIGMDVTGLAVRPLTPRVPVSLFMAVGDQRATKRAAQSFIDCVDVQLRQG